VVLEEVQVLPHELLEIMGLAQSAAIWTGEFRTAIRFETQVKLMRALVCIQTLIDQSPWRRHPETKGENFTGVHPFSSRQVPIARRVAGHAVKNCSDSTWNVEEPPKSGQGAVECGVVSQARRMTNLCPENRVRYRLF